MSADDALVAAIERLKRDRNAIVLAHYYQEPEFRTSPTSSGIPGAVPPAASTEADVIVFCGTTSWRRPPRS